ncbi:hypothetical protein [Humibacillus sp. DSM 29435]|uniref:hypothetical protein n=1 Tax=Humibacillus sp. DSM 29435 TaxID=1869167 RepID=UPI0015861BA9|nr:hypothetical protein [Humibacillus sp. DSM 29435]
MTALGRRAHTLRCAAAVMMFAGSCVLLGCTTTPAQPQPQLITDTSATLSTGPTMTAIAAAARCTTHKIDDDLEHSLRPQQVFTNFVSGGAAQADVTRLGPDGGDLSSCPGDLPEDTWCDQGIPWSGLDWNTFVTASGTTREVRQELQAFPADAAPDPDIFAPGARFLEYRQYDIAAGDPRGLIPYLQRAFQHCAHAKPTTIAGHPALAGTAPSEQGSTVPARYILFTGQRRVAWVALDGAGWDGPSRQHAVQAALTFMTSTQ